MNILAQSNVINDLLRDSQAALILAKRLESHKQGVNESLILNANGHLYRLQLIDKQNSTEVLIYE